MSSWLDFSQHLAVTIMVLLFFVVLALVLYDVLRPLIRSLRWLAKRKRSPEAEAVDAIGRYQGAFNLNKTGVVRQRFARRYEPKFTNHWGCQGKWEPYE